jgi:cysteine desulfurase/selenocysteine lyase
LEEITPDLIAQVASRLYNEQPRAGALPPTSSSVAMPGSLANLGVVPGSAAALPAHPAPPRSAPMPHSTPAPPQKLAELPSAPPAPSVHSLPSFAGAPAATAPSTDGLRDFVANIRQMGIASREPRMDPFGSKLRERFFSGEKTPATMGTRPLDVPAIRQDFPILRQRVHGKPLAWLDNAATTQKPQCVIDEITRFYAEDNSNIHRAAHTLAARATDAYEKARQKVQTFLGAASLKEIVFVRGTTEGINLITQTFGRKFLQPGDEVILSTLEHHANIVPWQMMAKEKQASLRVIPVNDRGEIMLEEYQKLLGPRTKVVALTQASNSLGTILPVAEMTQMAKRYGARVLIDGAQSVAHLPVNMQQLGCDFFVFSGHKIFGPTGVGVVYIKEDLHDILPPWQGGGNMIRNVTFEETTFSEAPGKFEAGTPNIADAVGLGAALDYVNRLGLANIAAYEHELLDYATARLSSINGLRLIGTAREKVSVLSFVLPNRRTEDIGRMLDQEGIAVRSGHHCSQPSLRRFGVETTVRPSLSFYNTKEEIDRLTDAIKRIQQAP